MDFSLSDEQRMILGTVREFVSRELMPLEAQIQRAELEGRHFPDHSALRQLQASARKAGLWGLLTPEEYGGANLGLLMTALITMETARALVPFSYGGTADNILYQCTPAQRRRHRFPRRPGDGLDQPPDRNDGFVGTGRAAFRQRSGAGRERAR